MSYILSKSNRKDKKWKITTPEGKTIHFGAKGYLDYTQHGDPVRKQAYIARHASRENWTKSGINTAGFWSYYIGWSEPTIQKAIQETEQKFGIKIILKR